MRRLVIVLLAALLLCGCGGKKSTEESVKKPRPTTEATEPVRQAEEVEKIINQDTLVDLIRLELAYNADPDRAQYIGKLEELAKITVTDYTRDADTITATVTVAAPNMYAIAKAMEKEPFTDAAAIDASICAELEASEDIVTKTCTLVFQQVEEAWSVAFTEEFADALYGGLITYRNESMANLEVQ